MDSWSHYLDQLLFAVLPYVAVVVLVLMTIQRYRQQSFSYSSLSSQFLENRHHFWGLVPFHYGILVVIGGHIVAFLIPPGILLWNSHPLRLYVLELSALIFALLTLVGLLAAMVRRWTNPKIRPIKLEGNPEHALSRGGLCAVGQASILGLYDRQRLQGPKKNQSDSTWQEVDADIRGQLDGIRERRGAIRILSNTILSPTTREQMRPFLNRFTEADCDARHVVYDTLSSSAIRDAHQQTHGVRALPHYRLDRAEVIVSFDADFLGAWISPVEFTRDYHVGRSLAGSPPRCSLHVQFEARLSLTGAKADERQRVLPGEIGLLLTHLAKAIAGGAWASGTPEDAPIPAEQIRRLARQLRDARGKSLVLCGSQDVGEQKLCNLINHLLGNYGRDKPIDLERPSLQRQGNDADLQQLVQDLKNDRVAVLILFDCNPVYDLPGSNDLSAAIQRVALSVSCPERLDETAAFVRYVCAFLLLGVVAVTYQISTGIGTWGLNRTIGWAFDITNFVFWVGIGHAGTLISAILFLFRQKWRTAVNRSAEAMTLFAVMCAGLFPVIHMGRPWLAFWMAPYPNDRGPLWVNFRSPLIWDFFAISTYFLISLLFWYVGLIPDLATVRDRTPAGWRKRLFAFFSLGWNGSFRTWHRYELVYLLLAGLATLLVVSVHSIVSTDFATAVLPGWHATIFPPYFVAGAIFSGMAMVLCLMLIARAVMRLQDYITIRHVEAMTKMILATSCLVALAYGIEFFSALYSGNEYEYFVFMNRAVGPLAWGYWIMVGCNVVLPQLFWFKIIRTTVPLVFVLTIFVNIGMWFERYIIIVSSLHRDFLPSSWSTYTPTLVEIATLLGSFGLFFTCFLLFCRFLPMIAMAEIKGVLPRG